jgi:hypothetical protein
VPRRRKREEMEHIEELKRRTQKNKRIQREGERTNGRDGRREARVIKRRKRITN